MRSILTILLLALVLRSSAQTPVLWGMATGGGAHDKGTLFHVAADGTAFTKVFDFDDASGWGPEGGLCAAPNGKLYGATTHGGEGNSVAGTLFSFDPNGAGFHKILDFDITNGGGNWGELVPGGDGLLYGAQYMGSGNGGSIYTVDPTTDAYTIVHGLNQSTEGSGVTDKLLLGSDGWLYGTAHFGGAHNSGTIFRFDPATHAFETLYDLAGGDGGDTPYGGLCEAASGWMYGTTFSGGANAKGIIYKYHPVSDQFVKLADMDTIPGLYCWSSMVIAGPDLVIGTVTTGGNFGSGFIYAIVPSTDAFSEVYSFGTATGGTQLGNDIVASDGLVYGLCQGGGTFGMGTAYKFDPISHALTLLHSFDLTNDGGMPRGELVEAGGPVGIAEQSGHIDVQVTPNPTDGSLTVFCANARAGRTAYTITDALGRAVASGTLAGERTVLQLPAAPGAYALTIIADTTRRTVRFVRR
ncbi:MAG: choice-of-anchor tandem repeat GloVer-containing protein [Flavobacteriales bacterium]